METKQMKQQPNLPADRQEIIDSFKTMNIMNRYHKLYISLGLCLVSLLSYGQTNKNYVRSHAVKVSGVTSESTDLNAKTKEEVSTTTNFVDGLGRPLQSVTKKASPAGNDIIQYMEYDAFGRQVKTFLPFSGLGMTGGKHSDGLFKSGVDDAQNSFFDTHFGGTSGDYAFSESELEASPLSRMLKSFAPGQPWAKTSGNKPVEYEHLINDNTDLVFLWRIENDILMAYDYYQTGELYKTVTTDENAGTDEGEVIEFKNKQGQVVLKRVLKTTGNYLETYYVYDDFGNLRYVLPPMISASYSGTNLVAPAGYHLVTRDTALTVAPNIDLAYIPSAWVKVLATNVIIQSGREIILHGVVPTQDFLDKWAFQYAYDDRNRMIEKKVPGADKVYMIYDEQDRLVLTQDGNQRTSSTWSFTKYDVLNRPIITGEKVISGSVSSIRTAVAGLSVFHETYDAVGLHKYTNVAYPTGIMDADIHTITYYDNYQAVSKSFITPPVGRFTADNHKIIPSAFTNIKGQVAGTKTKILGTTNEYVESVNFYDNRYRLIQSQVTNYKGGDDVITTQYDFAGRVRKTFLEFDNPDGDVTTATVAQNYTYDHADRLLTVDHSIDGATAQVIVENTYNELGELETKKLHDEGNAFAQSVDYAYNMRGWLTKMNDPAVTDPDKYFSMNLKYDKASSGHQAYNGNIGTIDWKNPLESTTNTFDYSYDRLNRITDADFTASNDYDVNGITYDDNGNILTLVRRGLKTDGTMGDIDNLDYDYDGNQLTKVDDLSDLIGFRSGVSETIEYTYDNNGNMITDDNKGIVDIDYNYLNLPEKVDMGSGNYIEYTYDAAGVKLQQKVYEANVLTKTTDYMGGFIYEDNNLQFIQHDEGRVVPDGSNWEYQYGLKDHLGNTRVTFTTEDRTTNYLATLEDANYTAENQHFYNIDNRVEYPYTPATDKAARLNNADPIGPGISFGVVPGDVIDISVNTYYTNTSGFGTGATNSGTFANAVSSAFGGSSTGSEAQIATYNLFTALGTALLSPAGNTDNKPSAYLNYIVFDNQYNLLDAGFGAIDPVPNAEKSIVATNIEIDQAGFVYIYVSNESNSANYVYFDNLDVTINESRILEKSDYYPFGLTFNSYNKAGMVDQRFKYNSFEYQEDLGLNLYDYLARQYDPALGRFTSIDPAADLMKRYSPYVYAFDNPIRFVDPDGMMPEDKVDDDPEKEKSQTDKEIDEHSTQIENGLKIMGLWQEEPEKKDRKNYHSSSEQSRVTSIFDYFKRLKSGGKKVGNLDDVFDFNFYVKRNFLEKLLSGDWDTESKIANEWSSVGQGTINLSGGMADIGGEMIPVQIAIPRAFNVPRNGVSRDKLGFNFDSDALDQTLGGQFQHTIKMQEIGSDGSMSQRSWNIMIKFISRANKDSFIKNYLDQSQLMDQKIKTNGL